VWVVASEGLGETVVEAGIWVSPPKKLVCVFVCVCKRDLIFS